MKADEFTPGIRKCYLQCGVLSAVIGIGMGLAIGYFCG